MAACTQRHKVVRVKRQGHVIRSLGHVVYLRGWCGYACFEAVTTQRVLCQECGSGLTPCAMAGELGAADHVM